MVRHYDVITVGEMTIDAFMKIHDAGSKIHENPETHELSFRQGEKINVERYDFCLGGNAANVAVGLTRLGLKATICTEIGDDEFSIKMRNHLAKEHIERLLVTQLKNAPSNFSVIINFKGDRTIFSEDVVRPHDFQFEEISTNNIYLTSLGEEWQSAYKKVLEFSKSQENCRIIFNPGIHQLHGGRDMIHKVLQESEILIVNKEEGELLLFNHYNKKVDNSEHYLKNLCSELAQLGPKTVVMTNGKKGAVSLSESGEFFTQDIYPGKIVERTGSGDAFASGFLSGMISGLDILKCLKWGAANAASVIGQIGAEPGLLTKMEMEDKIKT